MKLELSSALTVIKALVKHTKTYLAEHAGIAVTDARRAKENPAHLRLRQFTVVIGVGGPVGLLIAFSFPREMIDVLYRRLTAGIDIPEAEVELYRRATISEIANVIVGHCTADLSANGERVSMSPPLLLEEAKHLHRVDDALFETIAMVTEHGSFDISLVGPRAMFDAVLNVPQ